MAGNGLIGALRVTLGANTAEFDRAMTRSRRTVAETNKGFAGLSKQAQSSALALKAAFAGIGVGAGVAAARSFLSIADEAKSLTAQLKLATAQSGSFAAALRDVGRIANDTRGGLTETAALYGSFIRASEALGATQGQAARATETFSKALKIGGAGANEAASATLQFGQALASGVLRGDEFNSIMEASPRIARLLADSLGVGVGQLRKMAEEGKLTSDVLFRALTDRKFTAAIDAEFKQMPVTFDQAMTLVHNAAVTTFGAFDQGGQFSTMIADFVGRGADGFADLAGKAETEGRNIRATFEGLHDAFSPMLAGARSAFGDIRKEVNYTRDSIANILDVIDQARNELPDLQRKAQAFDQRVFGLRLGPQADAAPRSNLAGTFRAGYRQSEARSRIEAAARRLEANGYIVPRNAAGEIDEGGIRKAPRTPPRRPPRSPSASAGGSGRKGAATPRRGAGGKSLGEETKATLDSLFPDDARVAELRGKAETLGKALAAKLIPVETYTRAKDEIGRQIGDLLEKSRTAVTIEAPTLPGLSADPADLAASTNATIAGALANATTDRSAGLDALRSSLEELGFAGDDAFSRIAASVSRELIPALQASRSGAADLTAALSQSAGLVSNIFQSIFGRKAGGVLGAIASIGLAYMTKSSGGGGFGGFRAEGGPITPNEWFVVGEKGPEIFAPGTSGTIIPNGGMARSRSQQPVVRVEVAAGQMFEAKVVEISGAVSVQTVQASNYVAAKRARQRMIS